MRFKCGDLVCDCDDPTYLWRVIGVRPSDGYVQLRHIKDDFEYGGTYFNTRHLRLSGRGTPKKLQDLEEWL